MPGTSAAAKKAWVTRRKNSKSPKKTPKKPTPKKSGKKKPRTAAQKAATKKMIAANKANKKK